MRNKERIPNNCRQVDDYKLPDQWIECLEKSYLDVKSFYSTHKVEKTLLPHSVLDMTAKKYEDLICFQSLCIADKDYLQEKSVISIPFYSDSLLFKKLKCQSTFFTLIDTIHENKSVFIGNLKHIYAIVYSFTLPKGRMNLKNLISGISSSEIPVSNVSLNAFWLTDDRILSPSETAYYVTSMKMDPSVTSRVQTINNVTICTHISFSKRFLILFLKIVSTVKSLFCLKIESSFLSKNLFIVDIWTEFQKAVKLKNYISNVSELWPCPVHVEVLHDLNVKTIIWSYSYYGARASMKKTISGRCLNLSFTCHSHIFLWDQKLIDLFKECEIHFEGKSISKRYYVSGPIINGSIDHLLSSKGSALENLKQEIDHGKCVVSVFDLPAWHPHIRRDLGIGLFTTLDVQNSLYKGIYELIQKDVDNKLIFLIKSKRKSTNTIMPEWLKKLVELNDKKRVVFLDESTSPVLLVKASDVVITTPFTSPSIIGELCGIRNFYLDPSGEFNFISISNSKIVKDIPEVLLTGLTQVNKSSKTSLNQFITDLKAITSN